MSSDPIDNCRRCGTPLCGEERLEDLCPTCLAEQSPTTFEAAQARYDAEAETFTAALESEITRRARLRYPTARTLHVRGEYDGDGFTVRPVRVNDGSQVLDDMSEAGLEDDIAGLLDWLGELTGDAYQGDHELDIEPERSARPPTVGSDTANEAPKSYLVRWEIDVEAADALDAARQALAIQCDPASTATFFTVHLVHGDDADDPDEGDVHVDLLDSPDGRRSGRSR